VGNTSKDEDLLTKSSHGATKPSFKDQEVENNSPSFQNLWDKVPKPPPNLQEIQKIKVIK
jgi:hypothetical protein